MWRWRWRLITRGRAAVDRYHGVPPYRETRAYVARVIREFNRRKQMAHASRRRSRTDSSGDEAREIDEEAQWSAVGSRAWLRWRCWCCCSATKVHFDWAMFWQQLRLCELVDMRCGDCADLRDVLAAGGAVGGVCVRRRRRCRRASLLGPQFIGFTAVALFGRLADLTRPYLVARELSCH